ncbi:MAG: LysR family transcriptional regulator [Calditrichaeota bacterium]|nr:LysR family transcriptional regulator [Calditrichota bacterium]
MLETKSLKIIQTIAESNSLTEASRKLFLSQSALSHQLKQIEDLIGKQVFHRINKKLVLTDIGKLIVNAAHEILPILAKCNNQIQNYVNGEQTIISICTQCNTSYHWLPQVIKQFERSYSGTRIQISTEATGNPTEFLLNGEIDLAIVIDPQPNKLFVFHELFIDDVFLLVSNQHPLSQKPYVRVSDFADLNYIMFSDRFENNLFAKHMLIPAGIRPKTITKVQFTEATIEMVKANLGVAVMSKWLVKPFLASSELTAVKITKSGYSRRWCIARLKTQQESKILDEFMQTLKTELQDL